MTRYRWIHARKAEGYELRWVDWRLWGDLPSVESIQETQAAVVG